MARARGRPIRVSLAEEPSAELEIHTTSRCLNHILSQSPGDDLKEVRIRIKVLHSRIITHLTIITIADRIRQYVNPHASHGFCHVAPPPGESSPLAWSLRSGEDPGRFDG